MAGKAEAKKPKSDELGPMPEWDLGDLYPAPDSPALERDLGDASASAEAFQLRYRGKLASLSGAEFGAAIAEYERISEILNRVLSFAQLRYAADLSDPERGQFQQSMQERATTISTCTLFFALEVNRIDDAVLEEKLSAPAAGHYRPWLRDLRMFRPHQLSDDIEQLLHEREVAGRSAWTRLFDETMADIRFPVEGKSLTSAEALHLLSEKDGRMRKAAAKSIGATLGAHVRTFALITNTLAKEKEIDDKWRRFERPTSARNLSNQVEDAVVDALVDAVEQSYGRLSHRYYALKAKWFGTKQLDYWDRNAPLPEADDRQIPWAKRRTSCSAPTAPSPPTWPRSASASSTTPGSTRRRGPASRPAPSPIRPCPRPIPTCCSTISARPAT